MNITAVVKFAVAGFHFWPEAKGERKYLSNRHRHLFYVQVQVELNHTEREIEFHDLLDYCKERFPGGDMGGRSCEDMAMGLLTDIDNKWPGRNIQVGVYEDSEVGAVVAKEKDGKNG